MRFSSQCGECPAGQFASPCRCSPCPPGTFSTTYGATHCISCPTSQYSLPGSTACDSCSNVERLFHAKPPWGRWHAYNWEGYTKILKDTSGHKRHSVAFSGSPVLASGTGNGATASQFFVYGNTAASIRLPAGSLPHPFTLCTMTRYNGVTQGRVINAFGANFLHGHQGGPASRGVANYGDTWATNQTGVGSLNDWLVMCGKSSGTAPRNVLVQGLPAGVRDFSVTGNLQLAINTGQNGTASDFAFAHAIVWNEILSDTEMSMVASMMMASLNDASINIATTGVCLCAGAVICARPTWARWHAVNYDSVNRVLRDSSGNNRHSTSVTGTVGVTSASGNGATVPMLHMFGDVNTNIYLPPGSVPGHFTLCVVSRYTGATRGRIFASVNTNFLHGHWNTRRGWGDWHDATMRNMVSEEAIGVNTDWLVFCGKNPGFLPTNILNHGQPRGVKNTSAWANYQLSINYPGVFTSEVSDWAVAHGLVWDQALPDEDMEHVSRALMHSLSTTVNIPALGNTTCGCVLPLASCSATPSLACQACTRCMAGSYATPACSSGSCLACPYGTFSASGSATACSPCLAGSFGMASGASACRSCLEGKYSPFVGMSFCIDVSHGTWRSMFHMGLCVCLSTHVIYHPRFGNARAYHRDSLSLSLSLYAHVRTI